MTSSQWRHHSDVITVTSSQWRHHSDVITVTSSQWRHHSDATTVTSPQWRHHSDVTTVTSPQWRHQWRHHSDVITVTSSQWRHHQWALCSWATFLTNSEWLANSCNVPVMSIHCTPTASSPTQKPEHWTLVDLSLSHTRQPTHPPRVKAINRGKL